LNWANLNVWKLAMNAVLERQMEQFQSRVQQKINLADDELERLSNYLASVKSEIAEAKDQINRLSTKNTQLTQELTGRDRRSQANTEALINRLRADHHRVMQDLQERHSEEVTALHQSYEEAIAELEQRSIQKITAKTAPIDEMLDQAQSQLGKLQETMGTADRALEKDALGDIAALQELEHAQHRRLESVIQTRNEERLESLLQAKTRLSDCVRTLEEMERNHTSRMASFKSRLDQMDVNYNEKLKRNSDAHARTCDTLNRRKGELETRARLLEKTIKKIGRHHRKQVEKAAREGERLKTSLASVEAKNKLTKEESEKVQGWTGKAQELKRRLDERENALGQARNDNDAMKRELARLQHQASLARRKAAPGRTE
jgi:chromosome segregation ATPase